MLTSKRCKLLLSFYLIILVSLAVLGFMLQASDKNPMLTIVFGLIAVLYSIKYFFYWRQSKENEKRYFIKLIQFGSKHYASGKLNAARGEPKTQRTHVHVHTNPLGYKVVSEVDPNEHPRIHDNISKEKT